jgi:hypothetical protein
MEIGIRAILPKIAALLVLVTGTAAVPSCSRGCIANLEVSSSATTFEDDRDQIISMLTSLGFRVIDRAHSPDHFRLSVESKFWVHVHRERTDVGLRVAFVSLLPDFSPDARDIYLLVTQQTGQMFGKDRLSVDSKSSCGQVTLLEN